MFLIKKDSDNLYSICRDQTSICSKVSEELARKKIEALGFEFIIPSKPNKWQEAPECTS